MTLLSEALAALARGWLLTPLAGKRPVLAGWPELPPPTEDDLRAWVAAGRNLGLRTGSRSGIIAIDVEPEAGSWDAGLGLPRTVTARSGRGGWHPYYRAPGSVGSCHPAPCPGNTYRLLGPHVDTRGEGGQVVYPGSVHPETGELYGWYVAPGEADVAELPEAILAKLRPRPSRPYAPQPGAGDGWAVAALRAELETVAQARAGDGRAHGQMCRSAFKLGQVAGAGLLELDAVVEQLVAAGCAAGWDEREARRVAGDCARSGTGHPRGPAPRERAPEVVFAVAATQQHPEVPDHEPEPELATVRPKILVPGAHATPVGFVKQGPSEFADHALRAIPAGVVYRRGAVAGSLVGTPGTREFRELAPDRARILASRHVEFMRWATPKPTKACPKPDPVEVFVPLTRDHGGLIADRASDHESVRPLAWVSSYPFATSDAVVTTPGYHASCQAFFDPPPGLSVPVVDDPAEIRAALDDAIVDFPFEDEASRVNFIGFLLTPLLRPAIAGNVPIHVFTSPIARTGKSRLIEQVAGIIVTGKKISASQLPPRPEDQPKWLFTLALSGQSLAHIDNLPPELDSGPLASMITAESVSDRLLGGNRWVTVNNTLTVACSGNNLRLSGELAKRSVVVRLVPDTDHPEDRTGFRHPDLPGYLRERRAHLLGCLLGAARLRRPPESGAVFGGFEEWAREVSGALEAIGYTEHLANRARWRERSDSETEALEAFVAAWRARWRDEPVSTASLLACLPDAVAGLLERPSAVSLGRRIAGLVDRRFRLLSGAEVIVSQHRDRDLRGYRLVTIKDD